MPFLYVCILYVCCLCIYRDLKKGYFPKQTTVCLIEWKVKAISDLSLTLNGCNVLSLYWLAKLELALHYNASCTYLISTGFLIYISVCEHFHNVYKGSRYSKSEKLCKKHSYDDKKWNVIQASLQMAYSYIIWIKVMLMHTYTPRSHKVSYLNAAGVSTKM